MAAVPEGGRILDITAPVTEALVTWPGVVERFHRDPVTSFEAGDAMEVSAFRIGAHTGTHVDAPRHFIPGAGGVESLSLEALVGDAYVLEAPPGVSVITAGLLERSAVPGDVTRLLFKTANSGWSRGSGGFREDFVACDESAAAWCLNRGVRLVGIDYLSVEPFDADLRNYPVHKALLGAGVVVVESLDLDGVASGRYGLAVLPLLVPGSDGAPARAILINDRGV